MVINGPVKENNDGVYVEGVVEKRPVLFTADTGASKTILSINAYHSLEKEKRPELKNCTSLKGAGGAPIKIFGKATFEIKFGQLSITHEMIVADIEDEALLGYDILNSADLLLSKNKVILKGQEIPCHQRHDIMKTRKVTLAEDVEVPGRTEAIIDVYVQRNEADDEDSNADFLVEPAEVFKDKYQLVMASTLVNINRSATSKVRVLNPFPASVKLKQDAVIGKAEKIERVVSIVSEKEHISEVENLGSIRRIEIVNEEKEESLSSLPRASSEDVPSHVKDLYNMAVKGHTENEAEAIAGLLVKHEHIFSRDEWDIGLTNLVEHPIKTNGAEPIRQRPRRVPLAYADEEKKAIEGLLRKGVIQKSSSPWASPIVLVKKKSGAIRPCVDYRKVNALVK